MASDDLEQRITRLEDLEQIKQLKARYCQICDNDHNTDEIITIFAEDGVWEGRGIGTATGHAEIQQLFTRFQKMISFSQHMVVNPVIEIDGTSASGVWYFFGLFTFYEGNQAKWQAARYHEKYTKVDGVWKIQHLRIRGPALIADYEKGWAAK